MQLSEKTKNKLKGVMQMQQNRKTVHPLRKQGERQVVVTLTHPNM